MVQILVQSTRHMVPSALIELTIPYQNHSPYDFGAKFLLCLARNFDYFVMADFWQATLVGN